MPFPCFLCEQVFSTKRGLANHQRMHTGASKQAGARISATRIATGVARGENNPNFGVKVRPWLEGDDAPLRQWHREHPEFGEQQRGAANPVHKVKHLYDDPEYVAKITSGIRAHVDQRRGSTYEEVYGVEKAKEYKQKLRGASPARLAQFQRKETKPERLVREMLEGLGISFQPEAPLDYYTVDFLLESPRVVIQADGDYWHANPALYPKPTRSQQNRRRLDASCDSFLRAQGYRVLRFWESDLEAHPENCLKVLQETLRG
jgi:very-short-patch-repair endonuclease